MTCSTGHAGPRASGPGAAERLPCEIHPGSVAVASAIASITSGPGTLVPASQRDTAAALNGALRSMSSPTILPSSAWVTRRPSRTLSSRWAHVIRFAIVSIVGRILTTSWGELPQRYIDCLLGKSFRARDVAGAAGSHTPQE